MPKLITPVQFEPSLDGLNIVRPLIMPDEGKTVISYPVLCKNLPSEGKPGVGKLARCTQDGALLRDNLEFASNRYYGALSLSGLSPCRTFTFPMRVKAVSVLPVTEEPAATFYWCSSDCSNNYKQLSDTVYTFLSFVGTVMQFKMVGGTEEETYILIYGFY